MKKFVLLFVALLTVGTCFGQARSKTKFVVDQIIPMNNLKIGWNHNLLDFTYDAANAWRLSNSLTLEYDRYIWHSLEAGLYVGAHSYEVWYNDYRSYDPVLGDSVTMDGGYDKGWSVQYGLNLNFHFQWLFNDEVTSWDAYVAGRIGGNTNKLATRMEFGGGIGGAYYFTQHWGIFAEALYGKAFVYQYEGSVNDMHMQLKGGFTFQF